MKPSMRVGIGFDFHPFEEGRELFLGGIKIGHPRGLLGHSDADVLVHAIIDALLGAASLGDLGAHFPDNDTRYQGVSSMVLLLDTFGLLKARSWAVGNLDAVIIAEEPYMSPFRDSMKMSLSKALQISPDDISIKATSMEGKGPVGRSEGIAAQAVVLLYQVS